MPFTHSTKNVPLQCIKLIPVRSEGTFLFCACFSVHQADRKHSFLLLSGLAEADTITHCIFKPTFVWLVSAYVFPAVFNPGCSPWPLPLVIKLSVF